jgi:hypothetical protein
MGHSWHLQTLVDVAERADAQSVGKEAWAC